jgi:tRNA-Thr(GGU) m(6)t(6)A37 methyltransferase TsaA
MSAIATTAVDQATIARRRCWRSNRCDPSTVIIATHATLADVSEQRVELEPIGRVASPLTELAAAPKQGDEGAPEAWIALSPAVTAGLEGIDAGDELVVITWLNRADRETLRVHPRGDSTRPPQGVFSTRSPDRPNPLGLHRVEVLEVDGERLRVSGLEAIDDTPVLDLKPVLSGRIDER